jgi:L-ascorbate metabolism protein UlaG (beta-lactamase superfamily)
LIDWGIPSGRIIIAQPEKIQLAQNLFVSAIPSAHPKIVVDKSGYWRYVGYVIEYFEKRLYHAGDTYVDDEIMTRLQPFGKLEVC